MANCVGFWNYKYFVLFLFWMTVSTIYGVSCSAYPFLQTIGGHSHIERAQSGQIHFYFILCSTISISVGGMFVWHLYLVLTQQTSIEFYVNQLEKSDAQMESRVTFFHICRSHKEKLALIDPSFFRVLDRAKPWVNIYDLGKKRNFESVFGKGSLWWRWAMPRVVEKNLGTGMSFETRSDSKLEQV